MHDNIKILAIFNACGRRIMTTDSYVNQNEWTCFAQTMTSWSSLILDLLGIPNSIQGEWEDHNSPVIFHI